MLQEVIANMPQDEAAYHMKRCVDSGLWLPEGNKKKTESEAENSNEASKSSEEIYQSVDDVD